MASLQLCIFDHLWVSWYHELYIFYALFKVFWSICPLQVKLEVWLTMMLAQTWISFNLKATYSSPISCASSSCHPRLVNRRIAAATTARNKKWRSSNIHTTTVQYTEQVITRSNRVTTLPLRTAVAFHHQLLPKSSVYRLAGCISTCSYVRLDGSVHFLNHFLL